MTKELLFFCTLAAGDIYSTQHTLSKGGYELNPLMRGSLSRQISLKASTCLVQSIVTSKFKKKKRLYILGGIIGGGLIANNIYQASRSKSTLGAAR